MKKKPSKKKVSKKVKGSEINGPIKPTVGRIVHVLDENGEVCPAIVLKVFSDTCVNVSIFCQRGSVSVRTSLTKTIDKLSSQSEWSWPVFQ